MSVPSAVGFGSRDMSLAGAALAEPCATRAGVLVSEGADRGLCSPGWVHCALGFCFCTGLGAESTWVQAPGIGMSGFITFQGGAFFLVLPSPCWPVLPCRSLSLLAGCSLPFSFGRVFA
jgi:hypothetical protein